MEQEALQEHINRGKEKKFPLTSSCFQVLLYSTCTPIFPSSDLFDYVHTCMSIKYMASFFNSREHVDLYY